MTLIPAARRGTVVGERWICLSCQQRSLGKSEASFSTNVRRSSINGRPSGLSVGRNHRRASSTTQSTKPERTRPPKLPEGPVRTRFAPSPTGYLHIGGLRTALFSYLLAKRTGGRFLLRTEDTDRKRLVQDAEAKLLSDLQWAGLEWDEGPGVGGPHGPYRQSERTEIYQRYARELLENGSAYRCFCSVQRTKGQAHEMAFATSGCYQNCASLSKDESLEKAEGGQEKFTVRLNLPPDAPKRTYPDLVYGKIQRLRWSPTAPILEGGEGVIGMHDTILLKSDGTPTYHLANVVDDHLMEITHVIRGVEWSASTPLHFDIYSAFGWTPPKFAHVGLLVDQNQAKLSKRNQDLALDVASMRDVHGVLPETLVNFLTLLGWSNPTKNDVMDMQALIDNFDLKFTKGNAMVQMEKLWFLQRKHVAERCNTAVEDSSAAPIEILVDKIKQEVLSKYEDILPPWLLQLDPEALSDQLNTYISAVLLSDNRNYDTASQWVLRNEYFFSWATSQIPREKKDYCSGESVSALDLRDCVKLMIEGMDDAGVHITGTSPGQSPTQLVELVEQMAEFMREQRKKAVGVKEELAKPLMKFLREKLSMGLPGPGIDTVMALLGPQECSRRLKLALELPLDEARARK